MYMHRRDSSFERTANARSRETSARYILQSYTLTAKGRKCKLKASRRYVSYLKQIKRKSFKRKASHAHKHTHTYIRAHISRGISVSTQVSGTRPKSCPRAKSLIVSLVRLLSFPLCRGLLAHPTSFFSNRKSSPALIAAKTRRDNCRHLSPVVPNCIA